MSSASYVQSSTQNDFNDSSEIATGHDGAITMASPVVISGGDNGDADDNENDDVLNQDATDKNANSNNSNGVFLPVASCEEFMERLELVHSFYPDKNVKWESANLDFSPATLTFHDGAVHDEFVRFCYRDLSSLIVSVAFSGSILYPTLGISRFSPTNASIAIATGCVQALIAGVDVFLYANFFTTVGLARIRRALAVFAVLMAIMCVSATMASVLPGCHLEGGVNNIVIMINPDKPGPTPERVIVYCNSMLDPYTIVALVGAIAVVRIPFVVALVCAILQVVLSQVGRTFAEPEAKVTETGSVIAVKVFVMTIIAIAVVLMCYFRERLLLEQFVSAALLEREEREEAAMTRRVDTLMASLMPPSVLSRLILGTPNIVDSVPSATVFFSDQKGFTAWSATRTPAEVVEMLNTNCVELDALAERMQIQKLKLIGDAAWMVCGLPTRTLDHAVRMVDFSLRYQRWVAKVLRRKNRNKWADVSFRVGIHSGPLSATIFGSTRPSYEPFGQTNLIAQQVEQLGVPDEVVITSSTLHELITNSLDEYSVDELKQTQQQQSTTTPESASSSSVSTTVKTSRQGETLQLFVVKQRRHHAPSLLHHAAASGGGGGDSGNFSAELSRKGTNSTGCSSIQTKNTNLAAGAHRETEEKLAKKRAEERRNFIEARVKALENEQHQHVNNESFAVGGGGGGGGSSSSPPSPQSPGGGAAAFSSSSPTSSPVLLKQDIERKLSERKYEWFLMEFNDEEAERDFIAFSSQQTFSLRVVCFWSGFTFAFAVFVSLFFADAAPFADGHGAVNATLFSIGFALLLAAALSTTFESQKRGVLEFVLVSAGWCATMIAAGLHDCAGCIVRTRLTVSINDVTYIHLVITVLVGFSVVSVSALTKIAVNVLTLLAPALYFVSDSVFATSDFLFFFLAGLLVTYGQFFAERHQRAAFLENAVARHLVAQQAQRAKEQRALLETMVPPVFVGELITWMATNFDPTQAIAHNFPKVVIAFITLEGVDSTQYNHNNTDTDTAGGGGGDDEERDRAYGAALNAAHARLDEMMGGGRCKHLIKIKSIAETVLLAGPISVADNDSGAASSSSSWFDDKIIQDAAKETVALVREVSRFLPGVKASAHVGEVRGACLGTTQISFDIFGDSVNVASRAGTTMVTASGFSMTSSFFDHLNLNNNKSTLQRELGCTFGEEEKRQAKGKGTLSVRTCRFDGDHHRVGSKANDGESLPHQVENE